MGRSLVLYIVLFFLSPLLITWGLEIVVLMGILLNEIIKEMGIFLGGKR